MNNGMGGGRGYREQWRHSMAQQDQALDARLEARSEGDPLCETVGDEFGLVYSVLRTWLSSLLFQEGRQLEAC